MSSEQSTGDESREAKALAQAVADGRLSEAAAQNVRRWLSEPAFAAYRDEVARHVREGLWTELDEAFWEVIPFGTGGRRGRMHPIGTAVVNARTIGESAQGLADYVCKTKGNGQGGRAVVARDSRHRSPEFAELTAAVLAAAGLKVFFFSEPRATPELSFAVRHLACDTGVMISASHNPPSDNGFKCYWSSGGQVLPPHDTGIIDAVYHVGEINAVRFDEAVEQGRIEIVDGDVDGPYLKAVCAESVSPARDVRVMYTPLHGVGESSVYRVLRQAGFKQVEILELQREPNGDFPNVPNHIPNPEVPAALEAAITEAGSKGIGLVLASDPDADRLGAAVRGADGQWVCLTGNQIAALLADHVLRHMQAAGTLTKEHYLVKTLVTSELVRRVGEHYGVATHGDLLVGFKYIAEEMDARGPDRFVFGAEESFGYLKGAYARDKDAAVAALLLAESAAELGAEGKTLLDRLDALFARDGYHQEGATSKVCTGPKGAEQIRRIMQQLRERPPQRLGDAEFAQVYDYDALEVRRARDSARLQPIERPKGNLLVFRTAEQHGSEFAFAARPSGTEPKIKFYFFARASCESAERLATVKEQTQGRLDALKEGLMKWVDGVAGSA